MLRLRSACSALALTALAIVAFAAVGADRAGAATPPTPDASFTFSPASPATGHEVTFDGRSSTCAATPCTYTWVDVGAGGTGSWPLGSGQTMVFTFQGVGTKYVRLSVRDAQGRSDTMTKNVVVQAGSPSPPPPPPPPPPAPPPPPPPPPHSPPGGCSVTVSSTAALQSQASSAPAGATVCAASGTYGHFTVTGVHRSSDTTIQPAPGATVNVAGFTLVDDTHLKITGLHVTDDWGGRILDNVTISGNDFDGSHGNIRAMKHSLIGNNQIHDIQTSQDEYLGAGLWINSYAGSQLGPGDPHNGLDGLTIKGNTFSHICSDGIQVGGGNYNGTRNVTIDRNSFDDIAGRCDPAAHSDSIQLLGGTDMSIINNRFEHVQDACMFKDDRLEGTTLVQNNLMIASSDTYGGTGIMCQIWDAANVVFRNNTISKQAGFQSLLFRTQEGGAKTALVENNALSEGPSAEPGITVTDRNNYEKTSSCTGSACALPVDANYDPTAGGPLVDAANANAVATDRLGRARNGVPDLGAQERQP